MQRGDHTTHAKVNAVANTGPPKPSWNPMAAARAVTVEEWDDGIPPDPTSCFRSHRLSLYLQIYKDLVSYGMIGTEGDGGRQERSREGKLAEIY